MTNFKKRHNICLREKHRESASSDKQAATEGRTKLQGILKDYALKDIFNFDETGLFYRLEPNKTLASGPVKGTKKCKDRISVGLCANADGSEKLVPVLIQKAKKPRCFSNGFNPETFVEYYYNKKAWITSVIFVQFIEKLERKMRRQKRKIILLVDNAPSHSVNDLQLRYVEFLPPNTTSEIQPMDAGVLRNFKVHYKRHLMKHYVQCLDDTGKLERINLKQAIYFTHDAWKDVKATTIANCYKHTGILPKCDTDAETDITDQVAPTPVLQELRVLLSDISVHVDDAISVEEYLAIDSDVPTEAMLTDQDIIALVRPDSTCDSSDDEPEAEPVPIPKVTGKRALVGLEEGLLYMEQEGFTAEHMDSLRHIIGCVRDHKQRSSRQVQKKLTGLFLHL